ncbi:MAG: 50S ribosomal protein L29 [Nanobdellota archaeon]
MKFNEIKQMDKKALEQKMKELNMDLLKDNSQVASGTTPKNPGQLREKKKTIARIKTVLNEGK